MFLKNGILFGDISWTGYVNNTPHYFTEKTFKTIATLDFKPNRQISVPCDMEGASWTYAYSSTLVIDTDGNISVIFVGSNNATLVRDGRCSFIAKAND